MSSPLHNGDRQFVVSVRGSPAPTITEKPIKMVTERTRTINTISRPSTLVLPPDSSSPDQTGAQAPPSELLPSGPSEDDQPPSGRPLSVFSTATSKPGSKGGKGRGKGKGKKTKMRKEEEDIHRVMVEEVVDEDGALFLLRMSLISSRDQWVTVLFRMF
jgi:hypothetical protein